MKFLIKLTTLLFIATISCPCELTGHRFCDHTQHLKLENRKDIRKMRTQDDSKVEQDSLVIQENI
jgi:hypothetical protein